MKKIIPTLLLTFLVSLMTVSCTDKKKVDVKAIEKIEANETEIEKETKELEEETKKLEMSLEELDLL